MMAAVRARALETAVRATTRSLMGGERVGEEEGWG
jgi:hypothetical protein